LFDLDEVAWTSLDRLVRAESVAVLTSTDPAAALDAAASLARDGRDLSRVVLEAGPGPNLLRRVETLTAWMTGGDGAPRERGPFTGACFGPRSGEETGGTPPGDAVAAGAEIGLLTAVLSMGVSTVRSMDSRVFHRVDAVVEALSGSDRRLRSRT